MSDQLERLKAALSDLYAIERQLGVGGMAMVYLAEDLKHKRKVAVKVLRPELAQALGPERFLREIEIAARLNHPHILTLIDSGEADGFLYFVMPYVEGDTLRELLQREGPLPETEAVRLTREIVDALAHAHKQGVVHRDVKPDNVMFIDGHAVVTDFGVAKALSAATGDHDVTTAGVTLGTPLYMSPEQASADPNIDHRADLYAVGVIVYEMLAGETPFVADSTQKLLAAHVLESPVPLGERREGLSLALADLVMRCLEKRPAERWQSAADLKSALDRVVTPSQGSVAVRGLTPPRRAGAWRKWAVAGAVAVVAVVAFLVSPLSPGGSGGTGEVSEQVVAVLPFTVRGSDAIAYLGEGMVNLLAPKLDGAGELRSVDTRALLGFVEREGAPTDPTEARRIAERFGAGLYVIGDVIEAGGQLQLSAALYGVNRGDEPLDEATADGTADEVFALVDQVAAQLLGSIAGPGTRVRQLASVSTASLPALKAYLECESLYRQGHFQPAMTSCQQAIAEDSSYALAYYRLSVVAELATMLDVALEAAEAAYRHGSRLSERDQRMVEGLRAWRRGQYVEAERLYRSLVGSYPDDIEALQQLGEVLFHGNPPHAESFTEAREPFERLLSYEPDHAIPLVHLARIAANEGRLAQMDSLVERYVELNPAGDRELEMLALQAFVRGDTAVQNDVSRRLDRASDVTLALGAWDVVVWTDNIAGAERITRIMAAPSRSAEERVTAHAWLAHIALAQGKWEAAQSHVAAIEQLDPVSALHYTALLHSLPFVPPAPERLRAARDALMALDPDTIPSPTNPSIFFRLDAWSQRVIRGYLIGLVNARLGEAERAEQAAAALEAMDLPAAAGTTGLDLAAGIRAQVALVAGDTARALGELADIEREIFYLYTISSAVHAEALERFTLAETLRSLGREEEAVGWYANASQTTPYEIVYRPWTHLRLAEIDAGRGATTSAREHYERFLAFWQNADPALQHWSDSARAGIAGLDGN